MLKPIPLRTIVKYGLFGLGGFLFLAGLSEMFWPLYQAIQLQGGGKVLGREKICADLLKGEYEAASKPIKYKTESRKYSIADIVSWLAKKEDKPYMVIPRSQLFTELPSERGPVQSCQPQGSANLAGDRLSSSIVLGYRGYRQRVTLHYATGFISPTLERVEFGALESVTPASPPPDEFERKMSELTRKLDQAADK